MWLSWCWRSRFVSMFFSDYFARKVTFFLPTPLWPYFPTTHRNHYYNSTITRKRTQIEPAIAKSSRNKRDIKAELIRKLRKQPRYKSVQARVREDRITEALKVYKDPKQKSVSNLRIIEGVFNIPYAMLYGRLKGRQPKSETGSYNTRLLEA